MSLQIHSSVVGPLQSNSYLVYSASRERAIIIDAGGDADKIIKVVKRVGAKVRFIVATHGHFDHVLAIDEIREELGCEFLIHEADEVILKTFSESVRRWLGIEMKDPKPDGYLTEGQQIDVGGVNIRVIHTPGHTPGSISLYCEGSVFTGDTLFFGSVGRTDLFGGDYDELVRSIRHKLYKLPDETTVYPGHGQPTTIGIEKRLNAFVREEV